VGSDLVSSIRGVVLLLRLTFKTYFFGGVGFSYFYDERIIRYGWLGKGMDGWMDGWGYMLWVGGWYGWMGF